MKRYIDSNTVLASLSFSMAILITFSVATAAETSFVRLTPLPPPKIVASAEEYPGGSFKPAHLFDGLLHTEFASNSKGVQTFVEFDFGKPVNIGAFRHINRNDPATVAASELTFFDAAGKSVAATPVQHVGKPAGMTTFVMPEPVTAQRVRWQVTKMTNDQINCAGGAEIVFYEAVGGDSTPKRIAIEARGEPVIERTNDQRSQPLKVSLDYPYATPIDAVVRVEGREPKNVRLCFGIQNLTFGIPPVETTSPLKITVDYNGKTVATATPTLKPVRKFVVYLLPHSHVDIGYTHVQPDVEKKQMQNLDIAMELCRKTANNPSGSQFKWNSEVLWAVDAYLQKAAPEKQQQLLDAIRAGHVGLDALYGNELTGLCRPEELMRLCDYGKQLAKQCNVTLDSAMISDVPGFTWGTVSALADAGVKYFSLGVNYVDSGRALSTWEDKPFYWLGPDGHQKLLCWVPYKGYALGHTGYKLDRQLPERLTQLEQAGYPYDIVQLRWNIGGDNGPPDTTLPDVVKKWNAAHEYPKMIIATTGEMFREFEKRYGDKVPTVSGDFTPYWENGACSSARETAINRTAAERLVQAEILSAMFAPAKYPAGQFYEAWRNLILYDEHTWGAYNSISDPDLPFVKDQWKIKQAFALDGDAQSQKLLASTLANRSGEPTANAVDVFNTSSWPRTDLVVLSKELSAAGDVVTASDGKTVPSQRLSTGELAFLAKDVPALTGRRYTISRGKADVAGNAKANAAALSNPAFSVQLDPTTGAIASFKRADGVELCDNRSGIGLNRYYYVLGTNVKEAKTSGPAKITVKEAGPLVASLQIESDAPGCVKLSREIRIVDGLDRVDLINMIDKKAVREKEGVHLGFAFNVPDGVMRMDIPWGVMRPEIDQIAGSCKNWFSVGRWADVSNQQLGVTWATLDAPMALVGSITIDRIGSVPNPKDWLDKLEPSQTLYSMVMNNHWWTNYKADQEGPTTFRYALQPHGSYDAGAAQRFGIECSQPLVVAAAQGPAPTEKPLLSIEPAGVVISSIQPIDDGRQLAVRLFNATGKATKTVVRPRNTTTATTVELRPWQIVTLHIPAIR